MPVIADDHRGNGFKNDHDITPERPVTNVPAIPVNAAEAIENDHIVIAGVLGNVFFILLDIMLYMQVGISFRKIGDHEFFMVFITEENRVYIKAGTRVRVKGIKNIGCRCCVSYYKGWYIPSGRTRTNAKK